MGYCDPKALRNGKAWCDVIHTEPLPIPPSRPALVLGSCNANGSGYKPYPHPVDRHGHGLADLPCDDPTEDNDDASPAP